MPILCLYFSLQLDLTKPIEDQGPLDVIIHKLTDVIIEADQNDSQSLELVHRFQVSNVVVTMIYGRADARGQRLAFIL